MIEHEELEAYPYFCESSVSPSRLIKHPRPFIETLIQRVMEAKVCQYCLTHHGSSIVFSDMSTMMGWETYLTHIKKNHPGLTPYPSDEDLDNIKGEYKRRLQKRMKAQLFASPALAYRQQHREERWHRSATHR